MGKESSKDIRRENIKIIDTLLVCGRLDGFEDSEIEIIRNTEVDLRWCMKDIGEIIKAAWETWRPFDKERWGGIVLDNTIRLINLYKGYKGQESEVEFVTKFLDIAWIRAKMFNETLYSCIHACERNEDIFYNMGLIDVGLSISDKYESDKLKFRTRVNKEDGSVYFVGRVAREEKKEFREDKKLGALFMKRVRADDGSRADDGIDIFGPKVENLRDETEMLKKIASKQSIKRGLGRSIDKVDIVDWDFVFLPKMNRYLILSEHHKNYKDETNLEYLNFLFTLKMFDTNGLRVLLKGLESIDYDIKDLMYITLLYSYKHSTIEILKKMLNILKFESGNKEEKSEKVKEFVRLYDLGHKHIRFKTNDILSKIRKIGSELEQKKSSSLSTLIESIRYIDIKDVIIVTNKDRTYVIKEDGSIGIIKDKKDIGISYDRKIGISYDGKIGIIENNEEEWAIIIR